MEGAHALELYEPLSAICRELSSWFVGDCQDLSYYGTIQAEHLEQIIQGQQLQCTELG